MRNLILVVVVLILAVLLASCAQQSTPAPVPTSVAYSVDYSGVLPVTTALSASKVKLTEWTWYVSPDNKVIYVDGVVENASSYQVRTVRVSAEFRDANASLLAVQFADIATVDLAPGQRSVFKLANTYRPGMTSVVIRSISWR